MSLLVVGALHWDVVVQAPRLPHLDETLCGQDVTYKFGGKGGNQAVAAARAGAKVSFAGRIGNDAAGQSMRKHLVEAGVDISQLQQGDGASGMSVAIVTEDKEYGAVIVSAENHAFDPSDFKIPADCRLVVLQNEMAPDLLPICAAAARKHGAKVIWNAAPAESLETHDMSWIDTLIVNRVEAAGILGRGAIGPDPNVALQELAELAPMTEVILTLGNDGVAFCAHCGSCEIHPAHAVEVISTHGAGDVFVGTFASDRLRGASLTKAVMSAQTAAAAHISQRR